MTYTAISLFSGAVDGLAIAAQAAGIKVTHHVEWDAWCCRVLRMNHPDSIVLNKDINDVHDLPSADIIFGGSPCQGWSAAGNQLGFSDPRYLWPQMLRIVRENKPSVVIHENVRGGVSKGLLDQISNDLESEGYETAALVFPAAVFGAPHERYRMFHIGLLAHASTQRRPEPRTITHASDDGQRHISSLERGRGAVADAIKSSGQDVGYTQIKRLEAHDPKPFGSSPRFANGEFDAIMVNPTSQHHANIGTGASPARFNAESTGSNREGGAALIDGRAELRQLPTHERALPQSSMGRAAHGFTTRLPRLDPLTDFHGFPAGQGSYQHPHEPPRTTAQKGAYAKERIQALGNACVPQQCAPIFRTVVRWLDGEQK